MTLATGVLQCPRIAYTHRLLCTRIAYTSLMAHSCAPILSSPILSRNHAVAQAHGTVAIDGVDEAIVTVLPAIRSLGAQRSAHVGRKLRIEGSGFSRVPSNNSVWLGAAPCTVVTATLNEIVCNVMPSVGAISATEVTSPPPLHSWNGPGLTLTQQRLNSTMPGCLANLAQASTSECAAAGTMPALVHLRQQAVFPHHTPERHDAETGELLVTRPIEAVLLSTTAWFVPPSNGTYELSLQPGMRCVLKLGNESVRSGLASHRLSADQRGCQSGRRMLQKGRRYPFHFALVLGSSNDQLVLSASVEVEGGRWKLPAPAEWFESVVVASPDSTPIVSVHVNGLQAVCRMAGGCAITVAPADMGQDHSSRSHRMLTTVSFGARSQRSLGNSAELADEELNPTPMSHRVLPPPALPGVSSQPSRGDSGSESVHDLIRRQLLTGCPSSCCVVIFRGLPGEHCHAVPLWDFSGWSHPGGSFVQASTLCGTVRYSWLSRSGQHVLQADPQVSNSSRPDTASLGSPYGFGPFPAQDTSLATLTGNAHNVGSFVDPLCSTGGEGTEVTGVVRWSALRGLPGYGEDDHVTLANGQEWLLDADMTVRSLTVQGTFIWDTSIDGLVLSSGYVRVQRGGM